MREFNADSFEQYGLSFNAAHATELALTLIKDYILLLVETKEKMIVGGIGGLVVPSLLNRDVIIFQEVFFYINPAFRSSWKLLIDTLENTCKDKGIDHIILGMMHNEYTEKLTRLYHMRGYMNLERHLIKRVNI